MVQGKDELEIFVGDDVFSTKVPALVCPECGEAEVALSDAVAYEREVAQELAMNGPVTGAAFQFMRKSLVLRAADLAALLGVSPTTISRWENDKEPVNRQAFVLVGSLVLDRAIDVSTTAERLGRLGA
jgi:YgiT-type zinc finger domain-containing protein